MNGLSYTERQIIRAILDGAAQRDFLVSVYDGEEWALKSSDNRHAIEAAIGATDATTLRFRRAQLDDNGKFATVGQVLLVHGNDCDVIADYSDNPAMADLLSHASTLAEAMA